MLQLPFQLMRGRLRRPASSTASLPHESTVFEDIVVRCVRYAFRAIPTSVNRVFFSKKVALPFLRWRMLRHGYFECPVHWREQTSQEVSLRGRYSPRLNVHRLRNQGGTAAKGLWIRHKPDQPPDLVVYYLHGRVTPS